MKKGLVVLLLLGAVLTGGYYVATGRLPWVALSEEEEQVAFLREEFGRIRQQWSLAGRSQTFGMDTTSLADDPPAKLDQLERTLAELSPKLKRPEARKQASLLRRDMAAFKSEMR